MPCEGESAGALDRGRPGRYELSIVASILLLASWAATLSASFLLSLKSSITSIALAVGLGCVVGIFILALFWVRPEIEVVPLGQRRLWRITKFLGTTLAAIIVAGIVKAVYS